MASEPESTEPERLTHSARSGISSSVPDDLGDRIAAADSFSADTSQLDGDGSSKYRTNDEITRTEDHSMTASTNSYALIDLTGAKIQITKERTFILSAHASSSRPSFLQSSASSLRPSTRTIKSPLSALSSRSFSSVSLCASSSPTASAHETSGILMTIQPSPRKSDPSSISPTLLFY